jgi:membrane-bound lytic murein transglycosylase D
MDLFYFRYDFTTKARSVSSHLLSHHVALGETLESIAKKFHTSSEEIKSVNDLSEDFLALGQLLIIPISEETFHMVLSTK